MHELRPLVRQWYAFEPACFDDGLVFVRVDRADGVDDRSPRPHAFGRSAQQLELQLWQRLRTPAEVRALREHAEAGTRRVDECAIEGGELGRQIASVGIDDRDVVRAEAADIFFELTCTAGMDLHGDDFTREHRRLPARRGAEIERALALA